MRSKSARRSAALALFLTVSGSSAHRAQEGHPGAFGLGIEVVARTLLFDLLDAQGRPLAALPADGLRLEEDGHERQILEIRRRVTNEPAAPVAPLSKPAAFPVPPAPQRFVLLALDPTTLGRSAWKAAVDQMSDSAEAFVKMGPVDVTVLTPTPLRLAAGATDPEVVRRALSRARQDIKPLDQFYGERIRFVRELQRIFDVPLQPLSSTRDNDADRVQQAEFAARELTTFERQALKQSVSRLARVVSRAPRPLIAVWASQGDPDTPAFVARQLPDWVSADDRLRLQGGPLGFTSDFDKSWRAFAADGVTLITWSRMPEALLDLSSASLRHSGRGMQPSLSLGEQPLTLFEVAAEQTGGELVQSRKEIVQALDEVGGRFELVYQSDDASEGWRRLRLTTPAPGVTVRVSPRVYVRAEGKAQTAVGPVLPLALEMSGTRSASTHVGRERVTLALEIDFSSLRARLPLGSSLSFEIRVRATPPGAQPMIREVTLPVPALPAEGDLHYRLDLEVPVGTTGYAVEARESMSGASGLFGPISLQEAADRPASPASAPPG